MDQFFLVLATLLISTAGAQEPTTQLIFYTSTTQLPHNNRIVQRGTTVLLECGVTPHQQQIHYNWTCPQPPCDGEYRKVYNNLILIVATTTTGGQYKCTPTPHGNEVSATLTVQTSLSLGAITIYNKSKLLLPNTLITDPQQIPNGLVCTTGVSGGVARFRFEDGTTILGRRQGQSTTVQSSHLNQNGQYVCFDGGKDWPFYIYFSNATRPTPQVSLESTSKEQLLGLVLTRPEGYNSGRFILRYDCGLRGIPIELEYMCAQISGSSDVVVRRSRSCFVVGEISRVTIWFVSGGYISSTPAVVNATSGEGDTSGKCPTPTTNTGHGIIAAVAITIINIVILLLTISILVILMTVLIVKRKKQSLVVNYAEESVQIYDEVDDNTALKKPSSDTKVYEELDVNKMEDRSQYATMK